MSNPGVGTPRVLVVDSVVETANLIELILRRTGQCDVLRADTLELALSTVREGSVDLVLLDAFFSGDASLDFCRTIREDDRSAHIPVILLSTEPDKQAMVRGFEAGCVDYLFKPLFPLELSARVRTHFQLKRQKDLVLERVVEQRELLQVLCHDIAGPVGAARGLLEMGREMPDLLADSIEPILQALGNVLEMTDLVRQMRSLEDGKMAWKLEPLSLLYAFENAAQVVRARLEEKSIRLEVEIPGEVEVEVERVSFVNSVIANLLTNAVKFSHPGGTIRVFASVRGAHVSFVVQDEGIGMPASILDNLFDLKVPTSRRGTGDEPGTGFGMPLVKKFVDGYGGSLHISSKDIAEHPDDHGTRVEVRVKAAVGAATPHAVAR